MWLYWNRRKQGCFWKKQIQKIQLSTPRWDESIFSDSSTSRQPQARWRAGSSTAVWCTLCTVQVTTTSGCWANSVFSERVVWSGLVTGKIKVLVELSSRKILAVLFLEDTMQGGKWTFHAKYICVNVEENMKTTSLYHHPSSYFGVKVSGDPLPSAAKHANQRLMNSLQISSQHGSQPSHQLSCKFCRLIEFHIKSKHHHFDSLFWRQFKKTDKQSGCLQVACKTKSVKRSCGRIFEQWRRFKPYSHLCFSSL